MILQRFLPVPRNEFGCNCAVQVQPLAEAAPVDFFTKNLWETTLPKQWRECLLGLDEEQLLGLPSLKCDMADADQHKHVQSNGDVPTTAETNGTTRLGLTQFLLAARKLHRATSAHACTSK